MYFTHILFHKHQQIGQARAPSPSAAKLIKSLRTKVREVEFTWESEGFVCLTKAEGEKRSTSGEMEEGMQEKGEGRNRNGDEVQVKSVRNKEKQIQVDVEMILET